MEPSAATPSRQLMFFPIGLFGSAMGITGLVIAFLTLNQVFRLQLPGLDILVWLATFWTFLLILIYSIKLSRFPAAVLKEYMHPVASNFFSAISISILLLSIMFMSLAQGQDGLFLHLAKALWIIGAPLQLLMTLLIVNRWIHHEDIKIDHSTPAWFIPVVGNIVAPIAGAQLISSELAWLYFAVGIVFWLLIKTILFYRIFFHEPLGAMLRPTLFIFIAPPAIGFLSYLALNNGQLDAFGHILYNLSLFMVILLIMEVKRFRGIPFALSFWAYTFPLAAFVIASLRMYELSHWLAHAIFAVLALIAVTLIVLHLSYKTFMAARKGLICQPPKH